MRKTLLFLFLFILLTSVSILVGFSQRQALACELIRYSNYQQIDSNFFVSPTFGKDDRERIIAVINLARSRIENTFGTMVSSPLVVITVNDDEASKFGSNAYGKAHLTPFGQCLVFGPQGHNVNVVAHEYVHSEVHYRVGWFKHYLNVPIWFNEGIALLVDYRKPYLLANIDVSQAQINAIKKGQGNFFTSENAVQNYQAARVSVERLDRTRLYDNLKKVKDGDDFNSVFKL